MPHSPFTAPSGETDWPSVSSIGDVIAKPGLYPFYAKHGVNGARGIMEWTADIGSQFHEAVYARLMGVSPTGTIGLRANMMVDKFFKEFVVPYKVYPITLEKKVVNLQERYHGTYDGIVHVTGLPYGRGIQGTYTGEILADWKTSSGIYKTNGIQLAGYWGAITNPPQHGLIVQTHRSTMKVRTKMFLDLQHYYKAFLNARALWDFEHSKGPWAQ